MLAPLPSLSSLLLLQCLTTSVIGVPTPQNEDDFGDRGFPPIPEEPQAPIRPCDSEERRCRDPTFQLSREDVFPDKDIFLITWGRPGRIQSSPSVDISKILTSYVEDGLPYFLKQLAPNQTDYQNKIPALVKEGAPLIVGAVLDFAKAKDVQNSQKLKDWTKKAYADAPCDVFAASTMPVLEAALDAVYFANNPNQDLQYGQKPTSHDLDYFIQPAYGPVSHRDGITVKYNSKFPAFQNGVNVANDARDVFVQGPDVSNYRSTPNSKGNPEFKQLARLLLKQFGHVAQWSAVDYLDNEMELKYLLGLCKADYKFKSSKYEVEARQNGHSVDQLLFHPIGKQFFEVWTKLNLYDQLGLPTKKTFSPSGSQYSKSQIYTLNFEKGDLQIKEYGASSRTVIKGKSSSWTVTAI